MSKPPTKGEMTRTVRAYLKHAHPGARDVQLVVMNSGGYAESQVPILTPPPDPLSQEDRDRIHREVAHDRLHQSQARGCFVRWWAELVALLQDMDVQMQGLLAAADLDLLRAAGIDVDRVKAIGRQLHSTSTDALTPPYTSGVNLWPTSSLTTTFGKEPPA